MLQLNPSETHKINRILRDWADNTTYYVRAKIYDAETRTLVDTINLTDNGSRWFSGEWKVPHDNIFGNGVRYVIVTEVYTDSGYTTRSENHLDEVEDVLVQQRWNPTVAFSGGGDYDNKTLMREIRGVLEEYAKKDEPDPDAPVPEPLEVKISRLLDTHTAKVLGAVEGVEKKVSKIPTKSPKDPEKVDLQPIIAAFASLADMVRKIPTSHKEVDLSPVIAEFARMLHMTKSELIDQIATFGSKELTLSFGESPEEVKRKGRRAYLEGLKVKHGIK